MTLPPLDFQPMPKREPLTNEDIAKMPRREVYVYDLSDEDYAAHAANQAAQYAAYHN